MNIPIHEDVLHASVPVALRMSSLHPAPGDGPLPVPPFLAAIEVYDVVSGYFTAIVKQVVTDPAARDGVAAGLVYTALGGRRRDSAALQRVGNGLTALDPRVPELRAWWLDVYGEHLEASLLDAFHVTAPLLRRY